MKRLCLSIFYNENAYFKIIDVGIKPFVKREKDIHGYHLYLSSKRGTHIRLVLVTKSSSARRLVLNANTHFKAFLESNPSPSVNSLNPETGFFKNFENNTIHYGVFKYSAIEHLEGVEIFHRNLSKDLIKIFEYYQYKTTKNLFEIIFKMLLILFETVSINTVELFDLMLNFEYQNYDNEKLKEFDKINKINFKTNKDTALRYMSEAQSIDIEWQISWRKTIGKHELFLKSADLKHDDIIDNYFKIVNVICHTFEFEERITMYYLHSRTWSLFS